MLLFADSMSHYTQPFMGAMYDVVSTPYAIGPSPDFLPVTLTQGLTSGRFGQGGIVFGAPDLISYTSVNQLPDGQFVQRNYDATDVIYHGLAVKQTGTQVAGSGSGQTTAGGRLLTLLDGATTQVGIDILPSGQLQAIRATVAGRGIYLVSIGTSGFNLPTFTPLGISDSAISSNAYEFLQFKVTHGATGSIEVRRGNGDLFWLLEGVNTAISGSNRSASALYGGYGAPFNNALGNLQAHYLRAIISDIHILNETVNPDDALDPVTFIGDRHWEVRTPTVDGFYTQWTPSTGSNHAALVDEIPPDDADYNSSSTVGNIDSFQTDPPSGPATASVLMAYTMYLGKDTGGATGVRGLFRLSGSDRTGTEFQAPSLSAYKQSFLASKPGGGAITVQDAGDGEHGYKLSS